MFSREEMERCTNWLSRLLDFWHKKRRTKVPRGLLFKSLIIIFQGTCSGKKSAVRGKKTWGGGGRRGERWQNFSKMSRILGGSVFFPLFPYATHPPPRPRPIPCNIYPLVDLLGGPNHVFYPEFLWPKFFFQLSLTLLALLYLSLNSETYLCTPPAVIS